MPNNIGEPSLVFASLIPNRAVAVASLGASIVILAMIWMIPRIWPMRLTYISVAFMKETEKLYYDAVEAGELPRDVGIEEKLLSLQKKVSEIREDSLRNSLSTWKALSDFFKGRSITLFQCMDEIQRFNTHLESVYWEPSHRYTIPPRDSPSSGHRMLNRASGEK
ncbi:hypothetical protein C8J57DRAFT_1238732 [Mycena rebaudengoi]|nr:hypothetical protein C8J57DRAFT_1238732 [Mycena rebaudengoi]